MNTNCTEPTLSDTLSDPVIQAMMTADGIEFHEFESFLQEMAQKVGPARSPCAPEGWNDL
jgi:hypothetical protein